MGATPSPFTPVQRPPRSALLLYLTASLLRTPPQTNVQFMAGFTGGAPPFALHSDAAPCPLHAPASLGHLTPTYTTKNPSTLRRGSIPSSFTTVQPRHRSTLLLYLASPQDTVVCRYAAIWICLSAAVVLLVLIP